MNKIFTFFCLFSLSTFAQKEINSQKNSLQKSDLVDYKKLIVGEWVKKDIQKVDGSKLFIDGIENIDLRYKFLENDSARVTYKGSTYDLGYKIKSDIIKIGAVSYRINNINEKELILDNEDILDQNSLKITLQPVSIHNLTFFPKFFVGKEQDTIYIAKRNYLEPFFYDSELSPMDFISSKFEFSEFKRGEFIVRFVITQNAEVRAIKVVSSTNEKYNKSLVEAVKASSGKWKPAIWNEKPVNTEIEMIFDLGWSEKKYGKEIQIEQEKKFLSQEYMFQGNVFYENKNCNSAIKYYTLSIENNYQNIDAYYKRAAAYVSKKEISKACEDFQQLKALQQKHAENLYFRYCKDFKETKY